MKITEAQEKHAGPVRPVSEDWRVNRYERRRARRFFVELLNVIPTPNPVDTLKRDIYPLFCKFGLSTECQHGLNRWLASFSIDQQWIRTACIESMTDWQQSESPSFLLEYPEAAELAADSSAVEIHTAMNWRPGSCSRAQARRQYLLKAARDFDAMAGSVRSLGIRYDSNLVRMFVAGQVMKVSSRLLAKGEHLATEPAEVRRKLRRCARLLGWEGGRFHAPPTVSN